MKNIKNTEERTLWDVVVIGGGAAGMMAAGRAGELGKSVLLIEKNENLGKKLLITGGGRCNLTNNKKDNRVMLEKYKGSDKFLFSLFSKFSVKDTLLFFNDRGMPTKEEPEGRVFPASNSAESVLAVLNKYIKDGKVTIKTNTTINNISIEKDTGDIILKVKSKENRLGNIYAKSCILATGGIARPETGSTGDGFKWLAKLGHTIIESDFALVPISLTNIWTKKLSGLTLGDIKLTTFLNNQKQDSYKGKLLFTHFGISGPTVLNMSKDIGELLKYGAVKIVLDLFPHLDYPELKSQLQRILVDESNKKIKNVLGKLIPHALVSPLLLISNIDEETICHSVKSEDRTKIVKEMKEIELNVRWLLGEDKAVIASGGVDLKEIDFKTMQSRIIPNLYIIGDLLNINRPSGGYSLQLCWSGGFVAGSSC